MDSNLLTLIRNYGDKSGKFEPGKSFIPIEDAVSNGDESVNLISAIMGDDGDYHTSFKAKLFDYLRGGYVNVVGSDMAAHILTLKTLMCEEFGSRRLKPGDEIITTPENINVINSARLCGIIPVLVDVDLHTLLPNLTSIETAIEEGKTKAVILSSPNGNPIDGEMVRDICDEFSIMFIEDVGGGFGGSVKGVPVGDFADVRIYSFFSSLLGSAGVVVSNSTLFHTLLSKMIKTDENSHLSLGLGSNKLMCSYLDSQMDKREYHTAMRRMNYSRLISGLSKHSKWLRFQTQSDCAATSWSRFLITIKQPYDYAFTRKELIEFLDSKRVECKPYNGNAVRKVYNQAEYRIFDDLVMSDYLHDNSILIGCNPRMYQGHVDYIVKCFDEFFSNVEKKRKPDEN